MSCDLSGCKTFLDLADYLISEDSTLQIPDYQRPYAWDAENVKVLLKDLSDCKGSYFLGLFLLNTTDDGIIHVIDGQQRLTTLFILLNLIRTKIGNVWSLPDDKDIDLSKLLYKQGYCRLFLQQTINNEYFQDLFDQSDAEGIASIQGKGYFSERCLKSAFNICLSYLDGLAKEEVERIVKKLFTARTIVYMESDSGMAMRIFELMNDRGKSLTNLEVVKSYAMSLVYDLHSKIGCQQNIQMKEPILRIYNDFIEINQLIEKINNYDKSFRGDEILLYHVIAFCNWDKSDFWNTKEQFKKLLLAQGADVKAIGSVISDLKRSYQFIYDLFSDIFESQVRKYKWFKNLYLLGQLANFYPLLLAIRGRFNPKECDDVLNVVCNYLELFSFRAYSINRCRSDTAQSRFYSLAKDITLNKKSTKEGIYSEIESIIRDYCINPNDSKKFNDNLLNPSFYQNTKSPCRIYLFVKYENYLIEKTNSSESQKYSDIHQIKNLPIEGLSKRGLKDANKKQATIDHIVPQEFNEKMKVEKSEYYYRLLQNSEGLFLGGIDESRAKSDPVGYFNENYLHSIGNLVLSNRGPNSSKGNNYPERKEWNGLESQREIINDIEGAETITQLHDEKGVFDMKFNVALIKSRADKIKKFVDEYWSVAAFVQIKEENNKAVIGSAKAAFLNRSELI